MPSSRGLRLFGFVGRFFPWLRGAGFRLDEVGQERRRLEFAADGGDRGFERIGSASFGRVRPARLGDVGRRVGDGWSEDPARTAGESNFFAIDGVDYTFSWAPAGTFKMGSPEDENYRGNDETLRSVKLTRGFWILQTEVTQAMGQSVMGNNPSFFKGGDFAPEKFPIEGVSWNDAAEFCKKASRMKGAPKGYEFRLPTEAQWEYACRAGSRTPFFWGIGGADRNCAVNRTRTLSVGDFKANNWNLYDMRGNVREWCVDRYGEYAGDATDPAKAVGDGGVRVRRGGAWNTDYSYPAYGRDVVRRRETRNRRKPARDRKSVV